MVARMRNIKCYSELILLPTFIERFWYLKLPGMIGDQTFGGKRYLNQILYTSDGWKAFRNKIIIRDNGCDLAIDGREIFERITVHHINPITIEDVLSNNPKVWDPENVIIVSDMTHKAIHYGDERLLIKEPTIRREYDTCPWKH
jgi:hypothetical protein